MGVSSAAAFIRRCKHTWRATCTNLVKAFQRMKEQADRRRRPAPTYQVGQRVWLSTKDIPIRGGTHKLAPRYVGPFTITHVLSPTAVRLRLPSMMSRIHPTFDVSRLKPVVTHALASAPVDLRPHASSAEVRLLLSGESWTVAKEDEDGSTSLTGSAMAQSTERGRRLVLSWIRTLSGTFTATG